MYKSTYLIVILHCLHVDNFNIALLIILYCNQMQHKVNLRIRSQIRSRQPSPKGKDTIPTHHSSPCCRSGLLPKTGCVSLSGRTWPFPMQLPSCRSVPSDAFRVLFSTSFVGLEWTAPVSFQTTSRVSFGCFSASILLRTVEFYVRMKWMRLSRGC